jgi:hypothetical protein
VLGFEKYVSRFEYHAHAALSETTFEQVTGVERWFAQKGRRSLITILGTVIDFVGVAAPTNWTLFHLFESKDYTDYHGFLCGPPRISAISALNGAN